MAFSSVLSAAIHGLHVEMIHVEADVSNGLPVFHMVGYLSSEVKEASERVRTAVRNSEIRIPAKKMVINLAPATVRKRGASFDLPIALALLAALGIFPEEKLKDVLVLGELGLDGSVQAVSGVLPIVMKAREEGCKACILPKQNMSEGALVENMQILGVEHLKEACAYLKGEKALQYVNSKHKQGMENPLGTTLVDYSDIQGQQAVKRAAEVAVAGGHNLLLVGPPGSGKSMMAQRIPTILPPPTLEESMEITKIYSVLGMVDKEHPLITGRPFRSVHHTVTKAALIGGGLIPVPGEISLAHGGVLFLDELAEFQKPVLEVLRQPLEEHQIRITRSHGNYVFPANFTLAAAMNRYMVLCGKGYCYNLGNFGYSLISKSSECPRPHLFFLYSILSNSVVIISFFLSTVRDWYASASDFIFGIKSSFSVRYCLNLLISSSEFFNDSSVSAIDFFIIDDLC